jgi:ATPase subunit of ABC transporter with duplicated ATPase domains
VCLLGRNGEGKSSLMQADHGRDRADSGEVWVRPGARMASLAQEVAAASDATVHEVVDGGRSDGHHGDWQANCRWTRSFRGWGSTATRP